ncbi:MAG: succinate dehydrogenase, cytochrome b556 subunit [Proteobacteria bacterium]|jgi:succinate dehydrogenase / fumarate reductase cytochrome b subunit|nr:succinate dehydrogenase, cytochrome b556 subunit [Pseudomonadota bacterium]
MNARSDAPRFLNLFQIRFPVGAICSIGHRVSGVILAAAVPLVVYALDRSLAGPQAYARLAAALATAAGKTAVVVLAWALAHHALAGIRHVLKDVDVGASLGTARRSAWLVLAVGGIIALATAVLVA